MTHIIAHRGANRIAPENTFAAAAAAVALGAHRIEIDVRESRDGVLYVHHDKMVNRTTNGTGALSEMTSIEIDKLDAGSWFGGQYRGQPVPRLEDYMTWLKGKSQLYIEIKECDTDKLAYLVRKTNYEKEAFFFSMDASMRENMRTSAPDFNFMIRVQESMPEEAKEVHGASIYEINHNFMQESLVSRCKQQGLKVMLFEPSPRNYVFKQALALGVDYFNIDDISAFREVYAEGLGVESNIY